MFEHRKYHALYFILGVLIAFILVTALSGCEQGKTPKGRDCIGFAGMSLEGEQCEVIEYPPPWEDEPVYCCMAFIPSCMACGTGMTTDEWIKDTCGPNAIDAEYAGWDTDTDEPLWLCQAEIVD